MQYTQDHVLVGAQVLCMAAVLSVSLPKTDTYFTSHFP